MPLHFWSEKEIHFVKKHYPSKSAAWIAKKLGRYTGQVKALAASNKLHRENHRMNEFCAHFITENIHTLSYREIATSLNLPVNKVKTFIYKNKLASNPYRPYTDDELQFIRDNYHKLSNIEIAAKIGRTAGAIHTKILKLKLKRTNDDLYLINQKYSSLYWFPKGNEPLSTKYNGYMSIRVDSHGHPYKYIRIEKGYFELLHRYNWIQKNGSIPEDKILRSIDGNQLNCEPDNWELIDRSGHLAKNIGRSELNDAYIISKLSARQPELKDDLRKMPELIELKRIQIKLRRTINELDEIAGNDK